MVDSEKNVNPIMDDTEDKNVEVEANNDFDLDLWDSDSKVEQKSPDLLDSNEESSTAKEELPKEEHDLFEDETETENELFGDIETNKSSEIQAEEEVSPVEDSDDNIEAPAAETPEINLSDESSSDETSASLDDADDNIEAPVSEAPEINLSDENNSDESTTSLDDSNEDDETSTEKVSFEDNFKERLQNAQTLNNEEDNTTDQDSSALLWKFDNIVINPVIEEESDTKITDDFSETILKHPAVLEKSPISQANEKEEQEKAKLLQKEKLAQLIKTHEKKSWRIWFTKWILSGIVLVACAVLVSCIFAKDQVLNIINSDFLNGLSLSANVVEVENNTDDEKNNDKEIANDEDEIDNEEISDSENTTDDETTTDEQIADVLEIATDEDTTTDNEEITSDETTVDEEATNDEETNDEWYSITSVESEEEANWVLPAHCSDLTCYGEDKEFTPCTTFRLSESLDENANRIGNNWVCRYKDPSELVYVEFN